MFNKRPNITINESNFPILKDFFNIKTLLKTSIGNRKIFHGGYIFTELLKQTMADVKKISTLTKRNVFVKQINKTQTKRINTGAIDAVIGRNTIFNMIDCQDFNSNNKFYGNNVGRYKVITKLDMTAFSKALQLDTLTTLYSKKLPVDFKIEDLGFIDMISSSENSPGISCLETVIGTFISSVNDCMPQHEIENVLGKYVNLVETRGNDMINLKTCWYVIINQSIFRHEINSNFLFIHKWIYFLRKLLKNLVPCIEVYHVSERLYIIYSLPLTIYKILPDGMAYSAMEVSSSENILIDIVSKDCNLHGPTALLIFNLNSNHLIRNTMISHAIKQCVSGLISSPFLKNETTLLQRNRYQLIKGVPFYCTKANVLILPLEYNIEDSCVMNAKAVFKKKLFTVDHRLTLTLHLENVSLARVLINKFPIKIKPNLVLFKFNYAIIVHVGKHLSVIPDPFDNNIMNLIWTPNTDLINNKSVFLHGIELNFNVNFYCDVSISYEQDASCGTKIFILNGAQKSVVGHILKNNQMPRLHNTMSLEDVANIDIDIIQHPFSLKRLGFNFLFTPEISAIYNECFQYTAYDKLKVLESKKDFYVSDPVTNRFYVAGKDGLPIKALLYEGYIVIMGKQNPYSLIHSAEVNSTPINALTGQPEVRYQKYSNKNNHAFGLSESEREILLALGVNSFVEEMYDLSDSKNITLENNKGDKVCVPLSTSAARVLDMLSLSGTNVDFSIKDVEVG